MKEKFYQRTWFVILMLVLIFPVGLILMWHNKKFNMPVRVAITILGAFIWLSTLLPNKSTEENIINENTTVEPTTIASTVATTETSNLNTETAESTDALLSFYLDYVNNINSAPFDIVQNTAQAYADANNYTIEVTQPSDEKLGTIKVAKTNDNYVYLGFYPNNNNIETLSTVEYNLNPNVSISASNNSNFYISDIEYSTRNTERTEPKEKVSDTNQQIEFLNNFK